MIIFLAAAFLFLLLSLIVLFFMKAKDREIGRLEDENRRLWVLCEESKKRTDELEFELEKTLIQVKILLSKIL